MSMKGTFIWLYVKTFECQLNAWLFLSDCVYIFVLKVWSEFKLVCVFKCGSILKVSRSIKSKFLHVYKQNFSYNWLQV